MTKWKLLFLKNPVLMYYNTCIINDVTHYNKFTNPQNLFHFGLFKHISICENSCDLFTFSFANKTKEKSLTTVSLSGRQLFRQKWLRFSDQCQIFWQSGPMLQPKFNTKMSGIQCPNVRQTLTKKLAPICSTINLGF